MTTPSPAQIAAWRRLAESERTVIVGPSGELGRGILALLDHIEALEQQVQRLHEPGDDMCCECGLVVARTQWAEARVEALEQQVQSAQAEGWDEGAAAGHHSPLTWFALRQVNPYRADRIEGGTAVSDERERRGATNGSVEAEIAELLAEHALVPPRSCSTVDMCSCGRRTVDHRAHVAALIAERVGG